MMESEIAPNKKITVVARLSPTKPGDDLSSQLLRKTSPYCVLCKSLSYEVKYYLDYVFEDNLASQKKLFEMVINPVIQNVLKGSYGVTFVYGERGSGKTYTLLGNPNDCSCDSDSSSFGIIPAAIMALNSYIENRCRTSQLTLSIFEVDEEVARDLLKSLDPNYNGEDNTFLENIDDAKDYEVTCFDDFKKIVDVAQSAQKTTGHMGNNSNVHTIYAINIKVLATNKIEGRLIFVDLSSSEHLESFLEAAAIQNELTGAKKSLFTLFKVLQDIKNDKTPSFSDSKLTSILKDALSPDCKIAFIATLSPCVAARQKNSEDILDVAESIKIELVRFEEEAFWKHFKYFDPVTELRILAYELHEIHEKLKKSFEGRVHSISGGLEGKNLTTYYLYNKVVKIVMYFDEAKEIIFRRNDTAEVYSAEGFSESSLNEVSAKNILEMEELLDKALDYKERITYIIMKRLHHCQHPLKLQ